jgi:hypothetical protein
MRVPVLEAPSEAEAQCATLTKTGRVFATGTEDVDALTFGTPLMLRNLTRSSEQQKLRHIQKQAEEEEEEEAPLEMTEGMPSSKSKKVGTSRVSSFFSPFFPLTLAQTVLLSLLLPALYPLSLSCASPLYSVLSTILILCLVYSLLLNFVPLMSNRENRILDHC